MDRILERASPSSLNIAFEAKFLTSKLGWGTKPQMADFGVSAMYFPTIERLD